MIMLCHATSSQIFMIVVDGDGLIEIYAPAH